MARTPQDLVATWWRTGISHRDETPAEVADGLIAFLHRHGYVIAPLQPSRGMIEAGADQDYRNELELVRRVQQREGLPDRAANVELVYRAMLAELLP